MDNDNVYQPRGGYYPSEPATQVTERDEEITRTLSAIPRLREAVERLDARIAFYGDTDAYSDDALVDPAKYMHITAGYKIAKTCLIDERDWFIGLIQEASKE